MNKSILTATLMLAAVLATPHFTQAAEDGHDHHPMPEVAAHPIFDQFKSLVGTWEGTVTMGENGETQPAVVTYRLTAGGTALLEVCGPGTPMEMVSVYFLDGDQMKMTHYCLANNQPTMIGVAGEEPNTVKLEFASITNMPDPNAMHMHDGTFEFLGDHHIRSTWNGYMGGHPMDEMCAVMDLKRKADDHGH